MDIRAILEKQAQDFNAKPAIIYRDEHVSFAELYARSCRLADVLRQWGLSAYDRLGVFLPNCPDYIFSYFAVFVSGGVMVPLDFMLSTPELCHFIQHSQCTFLITRPKKGIDYRELLQRCPSLKKILLVDDEQGEYIQQDGFARLADWTLGPTDFSSPAVNPGDPAAIFYTSGSTGHPKGVVLTYAHLDNPVNCITHFLKPTWDDSYLCAGIPFSHVGGLDYILFMLSFGSTLVLMDRFMPLEALRFIERYKPTIFCIVPSMFVALLSLKECDRFDLSSLRHLAVFGAPSSPALLRRFHQLCPNARLSNGWGMTETAAPNTYSPNDVNKINSIGPFGVGMEAKVVDENGQALASGNPGELWVRGKAVMAGYYNEPELTREIMTSDGWLKTGDIARQETDGNFYLCGRKKEMIKVAGEIVMAPEVEDVFHRHPAVKDVAVIGVADKMRGEVPKAFVVLREAAQVAPEELKFFLKEHLAHFKIPHFIEIRDSLPKNRTGKVDKEVLKSSCRT